MMGYLEKNEVCLDDYLRKAGFARGNQGTESLWLDSKLSVNAVVPSRDRSPEGNRG
jgi:hypothetical protein